MPTEGHNSRLVLGLDDALRGKVGRGKRVVHERAEAAEQETAGGDAGQQVLVAGLVLERDEAIADLEAVGGALRLQQRQKALDNLTEERVHEGVLTPKESIRD